MQFRITFINPKTGLPESQIITESDCWKVLNAIYSKMIPERNIKPVNFKLELLLDPDAE